MWSDNCGLGETKLFPVDIWVKSCLSAQRALRTYMPKFCGQADHLFQNQPINHSCNPWHFTVLKLI